MQGLIASRFFALRVGGRGSRQEEAVEQASFEASL